MFSSLQDRGVCVFIPSLSLSFNLIHKFDVRKKKHEKQYDQQNVGDIYFDDIDKIPTRRKGYTRCQLFDIYVKYCSLFYARFGNSGIKLCIVLC